jgi:hypothetical protein
MITRRNFLQQAGVAGASLSMLDAFPQPAIENQTAGFSLVVLATNWGFSGDWEAFARKTAEAGYNGVEVWVPQQDKDRDAFLAAMSKYELQFGLLCGGSDPNPVKHEEQYLAALNKAFKMQPLYINSHSGKDYFPVEASQKLIETSYRLSAEHAIPVYHETHRGRILYSAPVAKHFMDSIPDLRLTLDISHWCNVHESYLADQKETIQLALSRADHIHARIGHPEGPQVNDPRAPEWKDAIEAHLNWWDQIVAQKKKDGKRLTLLTEFGPADYMPTLPYTRQPLADQWEINAYMKDFLRKRYS